MDQTLNIKELFQGITYRVARTRDELEKSYALVYNAYLQKGYVNENLARLRMSIFNVLPETTTFVAMVGDEVIGTATVVPDSPLGLPMDDLYSEELNVFRAQGSRLCEISMLAIGSGFFKEDVSVMLNAKKMFIVFFLFKHLYDYIKSCLELDRICIAINPKHSLTYEYLNFESIGQVKQYDKVNGAPAMAKFADLHTVEDKAQAQKSNMRKMFFAMKTESNKFENKIQLSVEDIEYFADKIDLFGDAQFGQIEYIKKILPNVDVDRLVSMYKVV